VPTLTMHNASVATPRAAYAARRSRGERHLHAGAGAGPISTWISPRQARLAAACATPRVRLAASAKPGIRVTI